MSVARVAVLTGLAMLAFAGNSLLCRMALYDGSIDPVSFSAIRFLSAAVALLPIVLLRGKEWSLVSPRGWMSAGVLFAYAVFFSYAYLQLGAGTGALILFGSVQASMILHGLASGDRPGTGVWFGWLIALVGLVVLLLPGLEAPPTGGAILMFCSGIAWGIYSLRGQAESDPFASNLSNFVLSLPMFGTLLVVTAENAVFSPRGIFLALLSGALTSGLGYAAWYAALPRLRSFSAALVQLSVPVIAAIFAIPLLNEALTARLTVATALVLGGICFSIVVRRQRA